MIGGGAAYGAGFIDSGDIVNNSIESRDLENREAVKARDVRKNGLTGKEIKEKTLDAAAVRSAGRAGRPMAVTRQSGSSLACVNTPVRLRSPGRVLAIATGEFVDAGGGGGPLIAESSSNGDQPPKQVPRPGKTTRREDSFAVTLVTNRLARGQHQISLRCQEEVDDGQLASSSIAVIGISG